jgi:hypothetical protein
MEKKQLYALTIQIFTLETISKTIKDLTFEELQQEMEKSIKLYTEHGLQFTVTHSWE